MKTVEFEQLISVGCGIDVHKDVMVATVRSSGNDFETRNFSGFTSSLIEMRAWLKEQQVSSCSDGKYRNLFGNLFSIF